MKIIEADQNRPYYLMKNKFLHGKEYKELLCIVKKNHPNITASEIIEMFKKLSNNGCSAAMVSNIIGEKLYTNDSDFMEKFGFPLSINNGKAIDYNKILVDLYSKLYKVAKVKIIKYDEYEFTDILEAAKVLLKKDYTDYTNVFLDLFNAGYSGNGYSENGKMLFKNRIPQITEYIGSANEIGKKVFNIENVQTFEELKQICISQNIEIQIKDIEIYEKLTGLGAKNFEFWMGFYFKKYNLDFNFNKENIAVADFNNYLDFQNYILNLKEEGNSISVSAGPNKEVYMHNKKAFSWMKITTEKVGHIMLFKSFDQNEDIVVSSYGKDYIIPKEYLNLLEFDKILIINKQNILEEENSIRL